MIRASLLVVASALATPTFATVKTFGERITVTKVTSLGEARKNYDALKDTDLLATGKATKVCEKKGCWMTVKGDTDEVRVTFKDYGFFVPLNAAGQPVRMQGRLVKSEVSVADQKHLLEDAGAKAAAIDAVKEPKVEFSFVASGLEIGAWAP